MFTNKMGSARQDRRSATTNFRNQMALMVSNFVTQTTKKMVTKITSAIIAHLEYSIQGC